MLTGHPETIQRCCSWWSISDIGVRMHAHASGHRDGLGRCDDVVCAPVSDAPRCALLSLSECRSFSSASQVTHSP